MMLDFFTNKCQAYVDNNGRALSGAALEQAKHDPKARRCGANVKLRARFCRVCGSPAPGGWWRCGACGKWIGNESTTCSYCGHEQDTAARVNLDNGVWKKGDDVFAQRFELNDLACLLECGLIIQEGQCAILLRNGVIEEVLPPGKYAKEELLEIETYLRCTDSKSLIMVDLAQIAFPIMCTGLRSKEDFDLNLTCSVILRFDPENASEFVVNVMGNNRIFMNDQIETSLGYDAIARNILLAEVDIAVRDMCNEYGVDDLFKNPELRIELEDRISEKLSRNLNSAGLKFIRLGEVEFHGMMFEHLRKMSGDIETKRREIEFQLRADQLAKDSAKREAMSEVDIEDYLDQLAHEKEIKDYIRTQEMARLNETFEKDRAIAELDLKFEQASKELKDISVLEKLQAEHDEALKAITQDGEITRRQKEHDELLRQRLAEQNASLDYERIEVEIEKMRQNAAIEIAEKRQEVEFKQKENDRVDEAGRAETLSGLDIMTRISLAKTPAEAHLLLKAFKAMQSSEKDPMQLLAEAAAEGNADAAAALANLGDEKAALIEERRKSERELFEKNQEMLERMFNKATDALSRNNGSNNTTQIIK